MSIKCVKATVASIMFLLGFYQVFMYGKEVPVTNWSCDEALNYTFDCEAPGLVPNRLIPETSRWNIGRHKYGIIYQVD